MEENKLIQTLAFADPEFESYYAQYTSALEMRDNLPPELAKDVLNLVRQEDAELDALITAQQEAGEMTIKYISSGLVAGGTLVAAVFLLRSHIKIQKSKDGKWEFKFEHKPMEIDLLKEVLLSLQRLLNGSKE